MSSIFLSSGFLLRRHCFPFFLSFFLSFYIGVLILVWAASRQVVCMSPHAGGRRTYKLWSFMLSSDLFGICSMMCCVSIYPCLQRDVEPYPRGASLHLAYLRSRSLNPCERPTSMGACFRGHSRQCSGVCTGSHLGSQFLTLPLSGRLPASVRVRTVNDGEQSSQPSPLCWDKLSVSIMGSLQSLLMATISVDGHNLCCLDHFSSIIILQLLMYAARLLHGQGGI